MGGKGGGAGQVSSFGYKSVQKHLRTTPFPVRAQKTTKTGNRPNVAIKRDS